MASKKDNNDENSEKDQNLEYDENRIGVQNNNSIEIIPSSHHKNSTHFNLYKKK